MKKIILIVLSVVTVASAINPFSYNWTIRLTGDTATVTKWKANNDSVLAFSTRISDTLNKGVPRWTSFKNHDSTFSWMNIDTLPSVDTAFITGLKATRISTASGLTGNVSGNVTGSISGGTVAGSTGSFSSTVNVDSLHSTKGIAATNGNFSSVVLVDSIKSTKQIQGNLLGNITGSQTGGSIDATIGSFSSIIGCLATISGDSLHSNKGVSGTIGRFTTLIVNDTGSFACTLSVGGKTGYFTTKYQKIGAMVTLSIPVIRDSSTTTTSGMTLKGIPLSLRPTTVNSNGIKNCGEIIVSYDKNGDWLKGNLYIGNTNGEDLILLSKSVTAGVSIYQGTVASGHYYGLDAQCITYNIY